ncbi:hypothetical protein KAR91_59350 [Candidatus Pacearchaeota archaeon]|nr:hypothetical protein [Candidatus Pacearchaeota archaeon]
MSKSETISKTVPKALLHQRSNTINSISKQWITVSLVWAMVTVLMASITINFISNKYIFILLLCVMIVWVAIWVIWFRSAEAIKRTDLTIRYYIRKDMGMTYLPKFTMQPNAIEKFFPVKYVHEDGVIEFTGNIFGVLMDMVTPRVDENNISRHLSGIESTLNSLTPGDIFKTFACSRLVTQRLISNEILSATNDPDLSQTQRDHLYSMYDQLNNPENQKDIVSWFSTAVLCFNPDVKTIKDASIMAKNTIPGLTKTIRKAGVQLHPLTDPTDISLTYYQTVMQKEVKI